MSRQVPSSSIAVTFSSRRALLPGWMVQQVATQAGVDGLDVDATSVARSVAGGAAAGPRRCVRPRQDNMVGGRRIAVRAQPPPHRGRLGEIQPDAASACRRDPSHRRHTS